MKKSKFECLLVFFTIIMTLAGCGRTQDLPDTTSEDMGVFRMGDSFVDKDGKEITENDLPLYSLDRNGNITVENEKGRQVVAIAAENVCEFSCLAEAEAQTVEQPIPEYRLRNSTEVYGDAVREVVIAVGPENVLNDRFTVTAADPNTVCFADGANSVELAGAGEHKLSVLARYPGSADLVITNCLNEIIGTVQVTVTTVPIEDETEIKAIEDKVAACDHHYVKTIVEPTEQAEGYTQYTCTVCGQVYRSEYKDRLPCSHTFSERKVSATCTEKGYTLCTCTKCGFATRKDYTDLAEHSYRSEVIAPTCSAEGYTKRTCTICGHEETDTPTAKAAHKYESKTIPSTCMEQGYTLHTCSVCGAHYTDNFKEKKDHTYTSSIVAPTYMEEGYTLHACSVCGTSYKDSYTAKLVCMNHSFVESSRTEPGCSVQGSITRKCAICGQTKTESIPAKGHSYAESVVSPTCCDSGHTVHTCTVCGASYTDTAVPALGHSWEEHQTQKQVGTECHTFCSVCGADMTALGLGSAHEKAHILAEEGSGTYQNYVPKYETVTEKVCRRCGAVQ